MQTRTVPLHKRIYQDLVSAIQSGQLNPGDSLPTERELEMRYGVSRVPVRQALAKLETEGHIRRTPGRGTEVLRRQVTEVWISGFSHWYLANADAVTSRTFSFQTVPADEEVARHLGIAAGAPVLKVLRVRMVEGEPSAYMNNYFAAPELAEDLPGSDGEHFSLLQFIRDHLHREEVAVQEDLVATCAVPEVAEMLRVPAGTPVLFVTRRGWDQDGRPVELTRYWARTDKTSYRTFHAAKHRGG